MDFIDDIGSFSIEADDDFGERFKGRMKALLDSRRDGSVRSFGGTIFDEDSVHFETDLCELARNLPEIKNGYIDVYGDVDDCCIDGLFTHSSIPGMVLRALFNFCVQDGGSVVDHVSDEFIRENVLFFYEDDFEYMEEMKAGVKEFLRALSLSERGSVDEALKINSFRQFCKDLAEMLTEETVPPEVIARVPYMCMLPFIEGSEDFYFRNGVYFSHEVALYDLYKDFLPADIRKKADAYVSVFKNPGTAQHCCIEHDSCVYVFYTAQGVSKFSDVMQERGFNIFFEEAARWLDENLKSLREEYGMMSYLPAAA